MDDSTLERLADLICGNDPATAPTYRSGSELTRFFQRAGITRFQHDGSTRKWWTSDALRQCSDNEVKQVILRLASPKEYAGVASAVQKALNALNEVLSVEGHRVELHGVEPLLIAGPPEMVSRRTEPDLKPLPPPDFLALGLELGVGELLAQRWHEAERCVNAEAYLAGTVMMGSLLEGLLLAVCQRFPKRANQAPCVPFDQAKGKPKYFAEWSLAEMIEVSHAVGWIDLDVKKFSHALREFRNLIHPYQQLQSQARPDKDTCGIGWLVVQAAVNDLARVLQGTS